MSKSYFKERKDSQWRLSRVRQLGILFTAMPLVEAYKSIDLIDHGLDSKDIAALTPSSLAKNGAGGRVYEG